MRQKKINSIWVIYVVLIILIVLPPNLTIGASPPKSRSSKTIVSTKPPRLGSSQRYGRTTVSTKPPRLGSSQRYGRTTVSTKPPRLGSSQRYGKTTTSTKPPRLGSSQRYGRTTTSTKPHRLGSSQRYGRTTTSTKPHRLGSSQRYGRTTTSTKPPRFEGWLKYHEKKYREEKGYRDKEGGHTIERHVAKTDRQLKLRLVENPKISGSSTYTNQAIAEKVISSTIKDNRAKISAWLKSGKKQNLNLPYTGKSVIGRGIQRGETLASNRTNARVFLKKNGNGSYYILTSFPTP